MITCEFCGQFFDSRKALSCHARSHLRQLGVMWSVNESPIDLLRDILLKEGSATATQVSACMCAVQLAMEGRSISHHVLPTCCGCALEQGTKGRIITSA